MPLGGRSTSTSKCTTCASACTPASVRPAQTVSMRLARDLRERALRERPAPHSRRLRLPAAERAPSYSSPSAILTAEVPSGCRAQPEPLRISLPWNCAARRHRAIRPRRIGRFRNRDWRAQSVRQSSVRRRLPEALPSGSRVHRPCRPFPGTPWQGRTWSARHTNDRPCP